MGYALARAAADAGAIASLVSGPVSLTPPDHIRFFGVQSAEQMLVQCLELLPECDIFIACAAVADYRPATSENQKIKKESQEMTLQLVRTPDIVTAVATSKHRPYTVGFAAESNNLLSYARNKMQAKGLDMIIANDISDQSIGFNSDDNEVTVMWHDGQQLLKRANKDAIARQIVRLIAQQTSKID
jgi:phosphopantothenoylcysteine decarboxylase/phosphopantothenate--cysteine ligase